MYSLDHTNNDFTLILCWVFSDRRILCAIVCLPTTQMTTMGLIEQLPVGFTFVFDQICKIDVNVLNNMRISMFSE